MLQIRKNGRLTDCELREPFLKTENVERRTLFFATATIAEVVPRSATSLKFESADLSFHCTATVPHLELLVSKTF